MELKEKINRLLCLEKFKDLNARQKQVVGECIFANCLILSPENVEKYLDIIKNHLVTIIDLGEENYVKDNNVYNGIVESSVSTSIDAAGMIFPLNYKLRYKEFLTPFGRLTKSSLHEFGHLVVKKQNINLTEGRNTVDGEVELDLGGLVISKSIKSDYGHMISEILNELTTFLAFKSYLSYQKPNQTSEDKMRLFAEQYGFQIDKKQLQHLQILTEDFFESYTEDALAHDVLPDGTKNMFNPLYVKYTPLVRVIIRAFQNPCCSFNDFKKSFEEGKGLDVLKDGKPINDLLYGYYNSTFYVKDLFDRTLGIENAWESFCITFDSHMMESIIDIDFVNNTLTTFYKFYSNRLLQAVRDGKISQEQMQFNLDDFSKISGKCQEYYINQRKSLNI